MRARLRVLVGDVLSTLPTIPDSSVNCCVTSPPYFGLRDYGMAGQIGLEPTPSEYVTKMVAVFREVKRVLRDDGTLWLNLGDSYARAAEKGEHTPAQCGEMRSSASRASMLGSSDGAVGRANRPGTRALVEGLKPKDLIGIPWRVAFALQADGWYLRQDIIWHKPNPMPESVTDRCTKAHEYIFLLSKSERYYFDSEAMKEPAKYGKEHANKSTSWGTNRKHPNKANTADYAFKGDNSTCHLGPDGEFLRNRRSVWTVSTKPYKGAHFATFPPDLIEPCVLAGCPPGGVVLEPFGGSGTTAGVAMKHGRCAVLCELNPEYAALVPARVESIRSKGAA